MADRLQKILSQAGVASRRKAEQLILAGRVTVNGKTASLGAKVGPNDKIHLDGSLIKRTAPKVVFMLNKPRGYITTVADEKDRKTVLELVPDVPGLHPVGRLDKDSEGLLLLTTDGELTNKLTHPRYGHEKEYRVWTKQGDVSVEALERLKKGVYLLDEGKAKAVSAKRARGGCILVLKEGKKRQVRRMLAELDYEVIRLVRTRIGGMKLGNLPVGHFREIDAKELKLLSS